MAAAGKALQTKLLDAREDAIKLPLYGRKSALVVTKIDEALLWLDAYRYSPAADTPPVITSGT